MSEFQPAEAEDFFAEAIKEWEFHSKTFFETRFHEVRAAASSFLIAHQIKLSGPDLSGKFDRHLRICLKEYIINKYYSAPILLESKKRRKNVLKQLQIIQASLNNIDEDFSYLWGQIAKNSDGELEDIFSNNIRYSVNEAVKYFERTSASRPGPRSRFSIEIPVDSAIEAFETAAGRRFKRNFKISEPMDEPTTGFEVTDAAFVFEVLHTIDKSITLSNVRTALLKLTPKQNMEIGS